METDVTRGSPREPDRVTSAVGEGNVVEEGSVRDTLAFTEEQENNWSRERIQENKGGQEDTKTKS